MSRRALRTPPAPAHVIRVYDRRTRDYGLPAVNFGFFRVGPNAIATAASVAFSRAVPPFSIHYAQ
jgi:hypothetical protein